MLCLDSHLRTLKGHRVSHKKKPNEQKGEAAPPAQPEADLVAEELAKAEAAEAAAAAAAKELAEWKDRALRAAADLDNYRKRAIRDRDEAAARSQGEVLARIVEVVDDLARVAHLEPASTSSEALHEGMLAIERKFLKLLESSGVERLDPLGQPFDPNMHEAVATLPAPDVKADHTVGAVYQHGYRLRGALLRPARVAVLTWTQPAAAETVRASGESDDLGGEG